MNQNQEIENKKKTILIENTGENWREVTSVDFVYKGYYVFVDKEVKELIDKACKKK